VSRRRDDQRSGRCRTSGWSGGGAYTHDRVILFLGLPFRKRLWRPGKKLLIIHHAGTINKRRVVRFLSLSWVKQDTHEVRRAR
jgi:hypothetical protein